MIDVTGSDRDQVLQAIEETRERVHRLEEFLKALNKKVAASRKDLDPGLAAMAESSTKMMNSLEQELDEMENALKEIDLARS